jgi:TolA-binding protein
MKWLWILIVTTVFLPWMAVVPPAHGQNADARTYTAGVSAFDDGAYELAEKYFAEFLQTYTNSARVPEAILYRARAALHQQQSKVAIDLLTTNTARAGPLTDQYRYWLAETHRQSSNYQAAAEGFVTMIRDFPASRLLLEASFGEALARFKLQAWPRVIDLLRNTNGVFQKQSRLRPNDELVTRGQLVLVEALIESDRYSEAVEALRSLADRELIPEFRWRTQYLICRTDLAARRATNALTASTNLTALAAATGQRPLVAESVALRGVILERLGNHEGAIGEYEKNVTETTPAEYRRQALLRIIELTLEQDKLTDAVQKLETFFNQYPQDAASDVALLTLGELNLKRHFAASTNAIAPATNFLQMALGQFNRLITNSGSPFLGKAYLNRGWCYWLDNKPTEAQLDFRTALARLPRGEDQAIAQFKIADAQFRLNDFTNAIAGYRAVVTNYQELPRVQEELASQSLYQIVRASLQINDLGGATAAMQEITRSYGDSPFADRGLLFLGESYTRGNQPAEARALFQQFLSQHPNSPLRPRVELAIAHAYTEEQEWEPALQQYEAWLRRYGTNELRASAEFDYAHVSYQAGRLTNALTLFTSFLGTFPGHTNAPVAKYWVGSFYYDQKQYAEAESHFQQLFQNTNWPVSAWTYEAHMMAARCAVARQDYQAAYSYCLPIMNDTKPPPELAAEAFFAAGDALIQQPAAPEKPLANFFDAIRAFNKIIVLFPTNSRVALAWGRIGDCYRQLASTDPKYYENATIAYREVLKIGDASARSQAEVGLGQIMERLAKTINPELWKEAFRHYYNVVSEASLVEGEKIDPYWYKEAGLAAARLAEEHQQAEVATRIYSRLAEALPPLRTALQKKIEKVSQ